MYVLNAYRVLLTRARQGLVVFVPSGEGGDASAGMQGGEEMDDDVPL